jgi:hypothetical protein
MAIFAVNVTPTASAVPSCDVHGETSPPTQPPFAGAATAERFGLPFSSRAR